MQRIKKKKSSCFDYCIFESCVHVHVWAVSSQGNDLSVSFWGRVNSDLLKNKQV